MPPQFALVDITDHAHRHRMAVGKAWIENAVPSEAFAAVLATATNAMVPVRRGEIRRVTLSVRTMRNGVLTAAHLSLILRHNDHGVLTATILA